MKTITIAINQDILEEAITLTGNPFPQRLTSHDELINQALTDLVQRGWRKLRISSLKGRINWDDDLDS